MQLDGFTNISPVLRCGVYALVKSGVVVYIGKSKNMLVRLYSHRLRGKEKPSWIPIKGIAYDECHILPCRVEEVDDVEIAMIKKYRPRLNQQHNPSPGKTLAPIKLKIGNLALIVGGTPPPTPVFERRV